MHKAQDRNTGGGEGSKSALRLHIIDETDLVTRLTHQFQRMKMTPAPQWKYYTMPEYQLTKERLAEGLQKVFGNWDFLEYIEVG